MEHSLKNTLEKVMTVAQPNGQTGLQQNTGGAKKELMKRLESFIATGKAVQGQPVGSEIGTPLGKTIAQCSKAELSDAAYELASLSVALLLPPTVQLWLNAMEAEEEAAESRGRKALTVTLTEEERTTTRFEFALLEEIMRPAREKGDELAGEVLKFLSVYSFGLSYDEGRMRAKVDSWCEELEIFPMYAIREAFGWWRKFGSKEPSLAEVIKDCKIFCGRSVWKRRAMLKVLLEGKYNG